MAAFNIDDFISSVRAAAGADDAPQQVRTLMNDAFKDVTAVRDAMSGYRGESEVLFEDSNVSIWYCRFDPTEHVPPHDHQTTATIGVYEGAETNHFYQVTDAGLRHASSRHVSAGDVIAMGPDAIHSVECADSAYSYGLHVYLAPLTTIERSLFDWDNGEAEPFTDEAYERALRRSA